MSQKIVISRIQHRRGLKENLPQPLLPGELALAVDVGELWIGGDPNIAPWGVRVYDLSFTIAAENIVQNHILDIEFDNTFDEQSFNTLIAYLTGSPIPAVELVPEDILYDGAQHVFIIADPMVNIQNTLVGITTAIQNGANPVAPKYVSGQFLGERAPFPDPAFDLVDGVFLLGNVVPESNARQASNAARLINRYNGAGIVTTISNIRVPTEGATVGQLTFRDVHVLDADPWNNWSSDGTFSAQNTIDSIRFVSGDGIDIDIDTDNNALRVTNTSVAATLDIFNTVTLTDDETGFTWSGLGTIAASGNTDNITIVSGEGVEIETDVANNAFIIHSTSASDAYSTVTDGANTAEATGVDTLWLRSSNDILTITVADDDITYGDNVLFTVDETSIDHNALTNYEPNEHIDWTVDSGFDIDLNNLDILDLKDQIIALDPDVFVNHANVSFTGIDSITGGGDLTTSANFSLVNDEDTPDEDHYYGTDETGTKGWWPLPDPAPSAKNSIEVDNEELQLVGDQLTPGNFRYYGTDGTGDKGWYASPNNFGTVTVSSIDSGFTWNLSGTFNADQLASTFTLVSGDGIDLDVDIANRAVRITNTGTLNGPSNGLGPVAGIDNFLGDDIEDTFILSQDPGSNLFILVTVNGLLQIPGIHFTLTGDELVFDVPPPEDAIISVTFLGDPTNQKDCLLDGFVEDENEFILNPTVETIAAQDETDFDGVGDNGSFVGGDGDDGTPFAISDTITLSDGTVLTVDDVDINGDVTEFTITTISTEVFTPGATLTQTITSGTGVGFSLTTGPNNEAPSNISWLPIQYLAYDLDDESDVVFIDYSLNIGGNVSGNNNFTAAGRMKVIANTNADSGLALLIDDQADVRDTGYLGDVEFQAEFVSGTPNMVQIRYTNTFDSAAKLRITCKRWMSY